jgi:uncharacterized membrane protein YidH (DUF202 family)
VQVFERKNYKFFVARGSEPAISSIVKKFAPVRRRGMIHSVYCDNSDSSIYYSRLVRAADSKLLRYRWYGDDDPTDDVYIEVKTHRNDGASSKERFALSPAGARVFEMQGPDTADLLNSTPLSENARSLAERTARLVSDGKLKRVLRTEYYRTAFEDPEEPDFRASLDQSVTFVKEVPNDKWLRSDEGEAFIFPYSILELKISTDAMDKRADMIASWVEELKAGGAIDAAKFSKFLTGYSGHYRQQVNIVPNWMSEETIVAAQRGLAGAPQPPPPPPLQQQKEGMSATTGGGALPPMPNTPVARTIDRVLEKPTKTRIPDQKSIMANERTMLAWIRTTMLVLYGSSYFIDHDAVGGFNKVVGWSGVVVSGALVAYSYWQYKRRNALLVASETDLKKYVDNLGTAVFFAATILVSFTGFVVYQKSVLTFNNWNVYDLGVFGDDDI